VPDELRSPIQHHLVLHRIDPEQGIRRALCQAEALGLSEDRIRGALKTLEAIGFLDRVEQQGSRYKATEDGLHRKPIFFRFALDYRGLFEVANKAYRKAKERLSALARAKSCRKPRNGPPRAL